MLALPEKSSFVSFSSADTYPKLAGGLTASFNGETTAALPAVTALPAVAELAAVAALPALASQGAVRGRVAAVRALRRARAALGAAPATSAKGQAKDAAIRPSHFRYP